MNLLLDRVVLGGSGKLVLPWTLDLAAGSHGLCLADQQRSLELGRVVAGLDRPRRGRVLLGTEEPRVSPALRARMACTFDLDLSRFERESGQAFWQRVRDLRGRHGGKTSDPIGLLEEERLRAPLGQLSPYERQDFELELALSLENSHVVWLSRKPRVTSHLPAVLERLRQRAAAGAVVVVTVGTEREAPIWGDRLQRLLPGPKAASTFTIQLVVERPREIAAELQGDAAVLSTTLDAARPTLVLVSGKDELALRKACARAVVARRCELQEMVSLRGPVTTPSAASGGAR